MMQICRSRKALWLPAAALSLFLASCAGTSEFFRDVDRSVAAGHYGEAIDAVVAGRDVYGDKSSVLYHLDLGLLHHYRGDFDSSTAHLFAAEREIGDLYTKSISLTALSFVINDNVLPYEGEDHEKVLVNAFLALNFAEQGMTDDALVEARKVDVKLREYARAYDEKNIYREDAFIRYLTGVLYETGGETNDAFIAYRAAYDAYQEYAAHYATPAPSFLLDDIVRTATALSFTEEAEKYAARGGAFPGAGSSGNGTLLVIAYAGQAPVKEEVRPSLSVADKDGIVHTFQMALPKFVPRFTQPRDYEVGVEGADGPVGGRTEIAEDITRIAAKALDDRISLIYLKAGGRAVLKFLAAEKAKSDLKKKGSTLGNVLGSIAIDVALGATEQADTRSWRTLPAQIQIIRFRLPPGEYTVNVASSDGGYTRRNIPVHVRRRALSCVIVDDIR